MTIIDWTAQMAPIGLALFLTLGVSTCGIAASLDERERRSLRAKLLRVWTRACAVPRRAVVSDLASVGR